MNWKPYVRKWQSDYDFKTFLNSFGSLLLTVIIIIYSAVLGISHRSPWHLSISVYYFVLIVIRSGIILSEREAGKREARDPRSAEALRRKVQLISSCLLLFLNLCLIAPIALLVQLRKPLEMTLIPALAMAAYAFTKITIASMNLAKRKQSTNCLVHQLRTINFIDALVSIATLQNTLIMVVNKSDKTSILPISASSSALLWLGTVFLSVSSLVWGLRERRKNRQT